MNPPGDEFSAHPFQLSALFLQHRQFRIHHPNIQSLRKQRPPEDYKARLRDAVILMGLPLALPI